MFYVIIRIPNIFVEISHVVLMEEEQSSRMGTGSRFPGAASQSRGLGRSFNPPDLSFLGFRMRCLQTCYIKPSTLRTDVTGVPVLKRSVSVVPREPF